MCPSGRHTEREVNTNMKIKDMLLTGIFAALVIISSYVVIPIGPVPHSLQPFAVMLSGFILGPKLGALSIITWIVLGSLGLPVFNQGQSGIAMLAGPTGGFILSFVVVAYLSGYFTRKYYSEAFTGNFLYLALTMVICYIIGGLGFKLSFAYFLQKPMTWEKTFILAIAPFLPFDIIKAAMASYLGVKIRRALVQAGQIAKN